MLNLIRLKRETKVWAFPVRQRKVYSDEYRLMTNYPLLLPLTLLIWLNRSYSRKLTLLHVSTRPREGEGRKLRERERERTRGGNGEIKDRL